MFRLLTDEHNMKIGSTSRDLFVRFGIRKGPRLCTRVVRDGVRRVVR